MLQRDETGGKDLAKYVGHDIRRYNIHGTSTNTFICNKINIDGRELLILIHPHPSMKNGRTNILNVFVTLIILSINNVLNLLVTSGYFCISFTDLGIHYSYV